MGIFFTLAAGPALAWNTSPDGSTACDNGGTCASNDSTTTTAGGGGTPGAGNPLGGNPLGGDLTGGMGDPAPVYSPSNAAEQISAALIEQYKNVPCAALKEGFDNGSLDKITGALIVGGILTGNPGAAKSGALIWGLARIGRGICKGLGRW